MRDILASDIIKEIAERRDAPVKLIRDVSMRSVKRIFKLIKKPDRCIFMPKYPITSLREIHDGLRFAIEFYDIDETKFLTRDYRKRVRSWENYDRSLVVLRDGRKREIFHKRSSRDRVRLQDRRHRRLERRKRARLENTKEVNSDL